MITIRRLILVVAGLWLMLLAGAVLAQVNPTGVTAEALGMANLRAAPGTDAELVGQIVSGTRYPVIGRSEFFPWLLLGRVDNAQPLGWVFTELVDVQGNPSAAPLSSLVIGADGSAPVSTPVAPPASPGSATPSLEANTPALVPTALPPGAVRST